MKRILVPAIAMICFGSPAGAQDAGLLTKQSSHGFAATVDRLVAAIEKRGGKVAAKVDHATAAQTVGAELRPTTVVIFGNRKLGTPLMQQNQQIGLDLPLRVLVWQDTEGKVFASYRAPERLAAAYGITGQDELKNTMSAALTAITDEATKP
jgi:uncharacterized protein (DUF302 family)